MFGIKLDKLVGSLARTAGSALAGALIFKGLPPEVANQIIAPVVDLVGQGLTLAVGSLGYLAVQGLSIFEKKKK